MALLGAAPPDADQYTAQARAKEAAAARLQREAAQQADRVRRCAAAIAQASARLFALRAEQRRVAQAIATQRVPVARMIAALQLLTRQPPALALASPASLREQERIEAVIAALVPQVRRRTQALDRDLQVARALERDGAAVVARLVIERSELLQERARLEQVAQRLRGSARRDAQLALAAGDRALLEAEAQSVISVTSPTPPCPPQARFCLPAVGRFARSGSRIALYPVDGRVVAPAAGRVAYAGRYGRLGVVVILDHGDGATSVLAGLAASVVRPGVTVAARTPLGRVAVPGNFSFELRRQGRAVDPLPLVAVARRTI